MHDRLELPVSLFVHVVRAVSNGPPGTGACGTDWNTCPLILVCLGLLRADAQKTLDEATAKLRAANIEVDPLPEEEMEEAA